MKFKFSVLIAGTLIFCSNTNAQQLTTSKGQTYPQAPAISQTQQAKLTAGAPIVNNSTSSKQLTIAPVTATSASTERAFGKQEPVAKRSAIEEPSALTTTRSTHLFTHLKMD